MKQTICDTHNKIILILNKTGEEMLKNKESLADDKKIRMYALAIRSIGSVNGLIKEANKKALVMEEALRLRKSVMQKAGIEEMYQEKKKKMKDAGFFSGKIHLL
uniref:Uncharacterized protein n=2 Tax=viral metagenome TaxID=1070528 RepID=A0A6H1ZR32_9ZZZZ